MADSSETARRRKPKRQRRRKPKSPIAKLLSIVVIGVAVIFLIGFGMALSSAVHKMLTQPAAYTILEAQEAFENQHKSDREQNPIRASWMPLNHDSRKFNVLMPMPCKSHQTSQSHNEYSFQAESFASTVEPMNSRSPIVEVTYGHLEINGSTPFSLMDSMNVTDVRRVMDCDQINSNQVITWNGLQCRDMDLMRQGRRDLARFVAIGPSDYVILSFLFYGDPPQDLIDRFLNSFSLEGDPTKYGSPPGWPRSSQEIVAMSAKTVSMFPGKFMFPREMDRSRWLKLDDQPVDVLAHIDVFRDANSGNWYRYDKGIVSPATTTPMLVLPVEPVDSYEMKLEIRRLSRTPESFNIGLIVGGKPAMVVIDGFGGNTTCLSPLDGKFALDVEQRYTGRLLNPISNSIRVRVRPNSVQVNIDGLNAIDFKGDPSRLGLANFWCPPHNALFLADWETQYNITKCEMRKL